MTTEEILLRFRDPVPCKGGWKAICPAHDDNHASLSISRGEKPGFTVVKCFAGCSTEPVLSAVGLKMSDLMPDREQSDKWEEVRGTFQTSDTFPYPDEDGNVLYSVLRGSVKERNKRTGEERTNPKKFLQCRPDGAGGTAWNLKGVRRVLYRLPEVRKAIEEGDFILIPEGEKDCETIRRRLGLVATTNAGGADKWEASFSESLVGGHLVIIPDNDEPGRRHAEKVAKETIGKAASVRVLTLPDTMPNGKPLPLKGDISNWIENGGTPELLKALVKSTPEWSDEEVYPPPSDLPRIVVSGRSEREISADAWKAVLAANVPPVLFARSLSIVRLRRDADTRRFVIEQVEDQRLLHRLRRVAEFVTVRTTKTGEVETVVSAPPRIAKDMLVDAEECSNLPAVRAVMYAPVVSAKGEIIHSPGFYAGEGLFLDTEGLPTPPTTATRVDAIAAVGRLFSPRSGIFGEFPYATDTDRAHATALLLTPFLRPYIGGNAPLVLIEAPEQGSGKTLLAKSLLRVFDPFPTEPTAPSSRDPKDAEAEWSKVLATALKGGPSVLYFDNVRGTLASQSLEALLTNTGVWSERLLGTNDLITAWPSLVTVVASSNNAETNRDMARRCIISRLDPNMERPESRTGFRIPDLDSYIREHRDEVLSAVLTILQAWVQAGRPEGKAVKGSFQRWASVLSGVLDFLGIPGFLEGEEERSVYLDPETARWTTFVKAWADRLAEETTAKGLVELASQHDIVDADYKGASRSLAKMLAKYRGKVFAGYKIHSRTGHGSYTFFWLKSVTTPGDFGDFGDFPIYSRENENNGEAEKQTNINTIGGEVSKVSKVSVINGLEIGTICD